MNLEGYLPQNRIGREIYKKVLSGEEITPVEAGLIGREGDTKVKKQRDYPYKYAFLKSDLIGANGNHSKVFSLASKNLDLVAKFPKEGNWWKVERGSIMQSMAYEKGVDVAKPKGLYKIFNLDTKTFYSGFVMEHLGMLPINEIRSLKEMVCDEKKNFNFDAKELLDKLKSSCMGLCELHEKALKGYEKAKQKAELIGFSNIDYRETNAFWVPSKDKVVMIDCDEWEYDGD
ncbi:MAG: coiled-coil domain-containing protein 22 [Nanoarchaeota archaeon]|nr:coiled-coil domain-containing protein 22 [Nanoarchaeota archaeon]